MEEDSALDDQEVAVVLGTFVGRASIVAVGRVVDDRVAVVASQDVRVAQVREPPWGMECDSPRSFGACAFVAVRRLPLP